MLEYETCRQIHLALHELHQRMQQDDQHCDLLLHWRCTPQDLESSVESYTSISSIIDVDS